MSARAASLLAFLFVLLFVATTLHSEPRGTVRLDFPAGNCSGTAVGRYTILTAAHCFDNKPAAMKVDGVAVGFRIAADDGYDHVLVHISTRQRRIAKVDKMPTAGERLTVIGNPRIFTNFRRVGTLAGSVMVTPCDRKPSARCYTHFIDMNIAPGDSGAGVFNERGRLVAVISGRRVFFNPPFNNWELTFAPALGFTPQQWGAIR